MSKKMKNEYYFQNQFGVYNVVNNFVNEGINDGVKKELVKVTKLIINKPSNPSPLNNAINQNTSLTLSWYSSDPDEDPLTYDIYLGTNNPPTNKVSTSQTAKSYNATNLSNSTTYFWKIIAKDDHSHSTAGSIWKFKATGTAPQPPTLSSPANNATNISTSPTLSWNASSGATSYTLQVSANNSFSSFVYNQNGLSDTSKQVSGLSNSTTYFWRVSATNSYGTSGWSSPWSFTTESGGGSSCSGTPTVTYKGKTYHTVQIGNQCWLKENLDVGTMITSNSGSDNQTDNGIIEKYCYNNDPNNCTTYGGLYQWNEAMQYVTTEGTQGICPTG